MQLSHIFLDSLFMLQAINQLVTFFSLEINWEAVVKQFKEEFMYTLFLRVSSYLSNVKLMCFAC